MARANRHYFPNQVWHLTQRCHDKKWLLKFSKDRRRWLFWLYQARRRYGLVVLNYIVTRNHIHLLALDRGRGEIQKSMQLIAGRTAQEFNKRKSRVGAFWQDRYHATAVQTDSHLQHCITYIDLNMVRAGAVDHPSKWLHSGYADTLNPRARYARVDHEALLAVLNLDSIEQLQKLRQTWVASALHDDTLSRNPIWTESLCVGTHQYVEQLKEQLKIQKPRRAIKESDGLCFLQDSPRPSYDVFRSEN